MLVKVLCAREDGRARTVTTKRTRHTPEQVIRKLRDADRMLAEHKSIAEIAKELGVSENTSGGRSHRRILPLRVMRCLCGPIRLVERRAAPRRFEIPPTVKTPRQRQGPATCHLPPQPRAVPSGPMGIPLAVHLSLGNNRAARPDL